MSNAARNVVEVNSSFVLTCQFRLESRIQPLPELGRVRAARQLRSPVLEHEIGRRHSEPDQQLRNADEAAERAADAGRLRVVVAEKDVVAVHQRQDPEQLVHRPDPSGRKVGNTAKATK